MIEIISKQEGFRRCGIAHSRTPATYPDGHFTKEQIEQMKKEPMLIVREIADAATGGSGPSADGKKKKGE